MLGGIATIMLLAGAAPGGGASVPSKPVSCLEVLQDLATGAFPARSDFGPAACQPARPAFRYDPSAGLVRVARDLTTGEVVYAPPASLIGDLRPGSSLTVQSTVGPVLIERQVVVVRAIRGGGLLVRGADGRVFSAPSPEVRP